MKWDAWASRMVDARLMYLLAREELFGQEEIIYETLLKHSLMSRAKGHLSHRPKSLRYERLMGSGCRQVACKSLPRHWESILTSPEMPWITATPRDGICRVTESYPDLWTLLEDVIPQTSESSAEEGGWQATLQCLILHVQFHLAKTSLVLQGRTRVHSDLCTFSGTSLRPRDWD